MGKEGEPNIYTDAFLSVDFGCMEVRVAGQVVRLTPTEYKMLLVFLLHPRRMLSPQLILACVWGQEYTTPNLVRWHIMRLRCKLAGNDPSRKGLIRNQHGFGYCYDPWAAPPEIEQEIAQQRLEGEPRF